MTPPRAGDRWSAVGAVEEERFREKRDASFHFVHRLCSRAPAFSPKSSTRIRVLRKTDEKVERIITTALRSFPRSWPAFPTAVKNAFGEKLWVKGTIAAQLGVSGTKVLFTEHHQAHAAAAFLTSRARTRLSSPSTAWANGRR